MAQERRKTGYLNPYVEGSTFPTKHRVIPIHQKVALSGKGKFRREAFVIGPRKRDLLGEHTMRKRGSLAIVALRNGNTREILSKKRSDA